jgi:hypothetical protein
LGIGTSVSTRGVPLGLAGESSAFAGGFEFAVACGVDGGLSSGEDVVRGDVAEGAVKAFGVVMGDELGHDFLSVVFRERG